MRFGPSWRLALLGALVLASSASASTKSADNYIVLYKQQSVASDSIATIQEAGGSVIASYPSLLGPTRTRSRAIS